MAGENPSSTSEKTINLTREDKGLVIEQTKQGLASMRGEVGSSLLKRHEKTGEEKITDLLSQLTQEEKKELFKQAQEGLKLTETNLTESQKARLGQVETFSTLLAGLGNTLSGQNDAAFSGFSLWLAKNTVGSDLANLEQFLSRFDPVDASLYLVHNNNATLYQYLQDKYPGQIDMLKRITYHSDIPLAGAFGNQNSAILQDVRSPSELLKYRTEVVSFLRSDDSLGHYELARELAAEGLNERFEAVKGKIDEKKIIAETEKIMQKDFGPEWQKNALASLKASPENTGKTEEELTGLLSNFKKGIEEQTLEHLRQAAIGEVIFVSDDFEKYSPEEKALWHEYRDSMGYGALDIADESWDSIATEIAINAPLILVSGGVANAAVKGLSMGARAVLPKVLAQLGTRMSARVGGRLALKAAQVTLSMGVEGTAFEMTHHALATQDLNIFNEEGWQKRCFWSAITLGAFKGMGKLQQTAMMKGFAEKITGSVKGITLSPGLNKVLGNFPAGMQSAFGKVIYGFTAFETSRQMETSVMFLTGAAQATLSGNELDTFYGNLYDYCITHGGENYFHSMVSAHALNLAHTGTGALGKKLKDTLEKRKTSQETTTEAKNEPQEHHSQLPKAEKPLIGDEALLQKMGFVKKSAKGIYERTGEYRSHTPEEMIALVKALPGVENFEYNPKNNFQMVTIGPGFGDFHGFIEQLNSFGMYPEGVIICNPQKNFSYTVWEDGHFSQIAEQRTLDEYRNVGLYPSYEIQEILSGDLLPTIQKAIKDAGDVQAQDATRLKIAEKMIQKIRGNNIPLTEMEKIIIDEAHNIPATGPNGKYTPEDIAAKTRRLAEFFPLHTDKNIREALIRNGLCGNFDAHNSGKNSDNKPKDEQIQSATDVKNESMDALSIMQKLKKEFPNSATITFENISGWLKSFKNSEGLDFLSPLEILRGLNLYAKYPKVIFEGMLPFSKLHTDRLDFKGRFPAGFSDYVYEFASRERGGLISYTDLLTIERGELCSGENIIDRVRAEFDKNNSATTPMVDGPLITPEPLFTSQRERYDFIIRERKSMYNLLSGIENKIAEKLSPKILDEPSNLAAERIVTELLTSGGKTVSQECMARMLFATTKCIKGYQNSLRMINNLKDGSLTKRDILNTIFPEIKQEVQDSIGNDIDSMRIEMSPIGGLTFYMPGTLRKVLGDEISKNYVTYGFMRNSVDVVTLIVVYTDGTLAEQDRTLSHEEEHRINKFLFPEYQEVMGPKDEILSRTKDEILAFSTGNDLKPEEFLPGGAYFKNYKKMFGDFPGIEVDMCDSMMIYESVPLGESKGVFQTIPLAKWRIELTRLGYTLPPKTAESHTSYLCKKYPTFQKYLSDQAFMEKIPGKSPYNIRAVLEFISDPPKDIAEGIIFKLYGKEGIEISQGEIAKDNKLETLDWMIFISRNDFMALVDTVTTADLLRTKVDHCIALARKIIKQHYGVEYLGELTHVQTKELIEGIIDTYQKNPQTTEKEIVNMYLQSQQKQNKPSIR